MLFALSTSNEIGLATTGAIFIIFALLSSFVFPRLNPNFPGKKGLRWYLPLCCVFFVAMLSAVLYFGQEEKSPAEAAGNPGAGSTTGGTTTSAAAASTGKYAGGNAAGGKMVFSTAGCSACHTFTPAGSSGTIGPNLDMVADYAGKAGLAVDDFVGDAIVHPPAPYVPPGFAEVMPKTFGTSLSAQQIKDLVAFISAGP